MEVKEGRNCFYIGISEKDHIAIITYFDYAKNVIAIGHTYVNEEYRGKNLARMLLDKVVGLARRKDLKIAPMCSYAHSVFERNVEYSDVYYK